MEEAQLINLEVLVFLIPEYKGIDKREGTYVLPETRERVGRVTMLYPFAPGRHPYVIMVNHWNEGLGEEKLAELRARLASRPEFTTVESGLDQGLITEEDAKFYRNQTRLVALEALEERKLTEQ